MFSLIRKVSLEWAKTWAVERLGGELGVIFRLVDGTVRQSLGATFKSLLGINPLMRDVGLAAREEVFRATNVALIQSIASQFFGEVEGIVGRGLVQGTRPETMGEQIAGRFGVSQSRGRLIARDQVAKLHGQIDGARQQDLGVKRYRWLSAGDERVRPDDRAVKRGADPDDEATSHRARDGKIYSWDDPPGDPEDPAAGGHPGTAIQCLPGWSEVPNSLLAEMLYRRRYSGELTEIVADSGETIRVTPQHPVLTGRGWIPADMVCSSDHIFHVRSERFGALDNDVDHAVPSIEQLFDSLSVLVAPVCRAGARGQFHGDGAEDHEVEIVDLMGDLPLVWHAALGEEGCKLFLTAADQACSDVLLAKLGESPLAFLAVRTSTNSVMRGCCKLLALLRRGPLHAEEHRLAAVAALDAMLREASLDHDAFDAVLPGDSQLAHAAEVVGDEQVVREVLAVGRRAMVARGGVNTTGAQRLAQIVGGNPEGNPDLDQCATLGMEPLRVVEKRRCELADGHVYNLQTRSGWYVAQGFALRNCRCVAQPIIEDVLEQLGI